MLRIVFGIIFFLEIIQYFIIFDVLLSFLVLMGIKFRPKFLRDIVEPLYNLVKQYLPFSFGPFDFTPMILILVINFLIGLLVIFFPNVMGFM